MSCTNFNEAPDCGNTKLSETNHLSAIAIGTGDLLHTDVVSPSAVKAELEQPLKLLLYYHSLWIEDPFQWLLTTLRSFDDFVHCKNNVSTVLCFLRRIQPLITEGIIRISPLNYPHHRRYNQDIRMLDDAGYNDDKIMRWVNNSNVNAFLRVNRGIVTQSSIGGNVVVNDIVSHRILKHYFSTLRDASTTLRFSFDQLCSPLLRIDVPRFEDLSIRDLIAIRQSELVFEEWRNDVKGVMKQLTVLEPDPERLTTFFHQLARSELKEAALRLNKTLKKSSLKDKLRKGGYGFALGSIAAFVQSTDYVDMFTRAGLSALTGILLALMNPLFHLAASLSSPAAQPATRLPNNPPACSIKPDDPTPNAQ